uniref:Uncharacterized protein n=1 Tax=uncultured Desulfobacterium sp. TaxID=201089 RepID=E1YEB0_9BACT|nr:unknown protein [uncultured Desulfobacterium sp.]CBX28989.1 unknown protein [uncultured Desulfobacterium sp.]
MEISIRSKNKSPALQLSEDWGFAISGHIKSFRTCNKISDYFLQKNAKRNGFYNEQQYESLANTLLKLNQLIFNTFCFAQYYLC